MIETSRPTETPPTFPELLALQGLTHIAIIDDAFDVTEAELDLTTEELEDLWGELQFADEARAELNDIGLNISDIDDLNETTLASLFRRRLECPEFDIVWQRTLVAERLGARSDTIDPFMRHLRDKLGLKVRAFGSNSDLRAPEMHEVQMVFLDWRLGDGDPQDAIETAVAKVRELLEHWPIERPKPLIVLMSSATSVVADADSFRRRSGLLAGTFYAVTKHDLRDSFKLHLHLHMFSVSLPAGRRLQSFVEVLPEKIKEAATTFLQHIGDLTLADYAFIQRLSLQEDGHPLGDYILWLFGAYFSHLLFGTGMKEQRKDLDSMRFEQALPSQRLPSLRLTQIYQNALFDMNPDSLHGHPREGVDRVPSLGEMITEPMLTLGDVFRREKIADRACANEAKVKAEGKPPLALESETSPFTGDQDLETNGEDAQQLSSTSGIASEAPGEAADLSKSAAGRQIDLYMIINAQCDLAFTPEPTRKIEPDRSILLVPGILQPIEQQITDLSIPRTELFSEKGQRYRILWQPKKIQAVPYCEFHRWVENNHLRPQARLRLPFALEVQQSIVADVTRVGMPVAPPIYQPVQLELLSSKGGTLVRVQGSDDYHGFAILTRKTPQYVFPLRLVADIHAALDTYRQELARENETNDRRRPEQHKAHVRAAQAIQDIDKALEATDQWTKMLGEIKPPEKKSRTLLDKDYSEWVVRFCKGKSPGDSVNEGQPIMFVNLVGA